MEKALSYHRLYKNPDEDALGYNTSEFSLKSHKSLNFSLGWKNWSNTSKFDRISLISDSLYPR